MGRLEKVVGHLVCLTFRKLLKFRLLQRCLHIQSQHHVDRDNKDYIAINECSIPGPHHL